MLALTVVLFALDKSEPERLECNKGCEWKGLDVSKLRIMYTLMFCAGAFIHLRVTSVYVGTLVLSYLLRSYDGAPSIWCFSSALAAPIAVALWIHT